LITFLKDYGFNRAYLFTYSTIVTAPGNLYGKLRHVYSVLRAYAYAGSASEA